MFSLINSTTCDYYGFRRERLKWGTGESSASFALKKVKEYTFSILPQLAKIGEKVNAKF